MAADGYQRCGRDSDRYAEGVPPFRALAEWTQGAVADPKRIMHGVFRAAKTLRLDYTKLKRVTEADAASARVTVPPLRFVELAPANGIAVAECVIELEGPRGKMRIQWRGATPPDLAGLSRVLWESA
jgi:hypothetical protein